jgi:hypothetical protein
VNGAAVKNKANLERRRWQVTRSSRGTDRAKQSQSLDCGFRISDWGQILRLGPAQAGYAKQSQTWAGWGVWGMAHGSSILCRTKPIPPVGRGAGRRNAQNEANLVSGATQHTLPLCVFSAAGAAAA